MDKNFVMLLVTLMLVAIAILIEMAYEGDILAKDPLITTYSYQVFYLSGDSEIVSYELHKGSIPFIQTYKGSYWVDFKYPKKTIFGGIGHGSDGCVNGVIRIKNVK